MRIRLRKRHWKLEFTSRIDPNYDGFCDPPDTPNKRIWIKKNLRPSREIQTLLHEMLHACDWDLCEEAVTEIADDIGRVLYKLGYRRIKDGNANTG